MLVDWLQNVGALCLYPWSMMCHYPVDFYIRIGPDEQTESYDWDRNSFDGLISPEPKRSKCGAKQPDTKKNHNYSLDSD